MLGVLACLLTLAAAPCALVAGLVRARFAAPTGALVSAAAAALFAASLFSGGQALLDVAWLPAPFRARLMFSIDELGGLYATLVTALGAVVTLYSRGYLPPHLEEHRRPPREEVRFVVLLLAFMASMVALVLAEDLLLIFVALDITAVLSFLLIRFDVEKPEARRASLTALFVTAGPSPLFLAGVLLLGQTHGTTSLPELLASGASASTWAAGLMIAGLLAKSAQVPLHFWLPRAMVAPTPVSAFLHSAAMVAAGVIVLQRVRPLFDEGSAVPAALLVIGLVSIVVGSVSALVREEMKLVLAGSTIAQYGHVMVLLGLGGDEGSAGAPLYVLAHGLAKAALFLTAGAVTTMTERSCLSQLGGLFSARRTLALASLVAALTLAGAPLTIGYFKDELFFAAALAHGPLLVVGLVVVVALTVAYALRFWTRVFLGRRPEELTLRSRSGWLTAPIVALAVASLLLGLMPLGLTTLASDAGAHVANDAVDVHLSYSVGPSALAALCAWLLGGALFLVLRRVEGDSTLEARFAFRRRRSLWLYALRTLRRLSDFGHGIEARDIRDRVGFVLLPTSALVGLAALFTSERFQTHVGALSREDLPTAVALGIAAVAALGVASMRRHLAVVLLLSFVGFALAFVFSATGSPDVALVAVLIETIFTLLFLTVLSRVPSEELRRAREQASSSARRHVLIAALSGLGALFLTWTVLSRPRPPAPTGAYLELADDAHAKDVVTAILADFRGFDTMGEMTVLLIAAVGVLAMQWRRRPA